ncbi:YjbF family lipoprotein [Paracoccaceae bacterium]|nr:YjbF family lipoprotein [Paracoccaceae bacterium]
MRKLNLLIILFLFSACTNDETIRANKAGFTNIYKNILFRSFDGNGEKDLTSDSVYSKRWLSKFNQPIIGLSSPQQTEKATLVALGNKNNTLTWVSADGISVSFEKGILIATRGYSQDLMESQHNYLDTLFTQNPKNRSKTFRYLNGQNRYVELTFFCSLVSKESTTSFLSDFKLKTTKFTESCASGNTSHSNEYYVLPNTNIILKSKQWISKTNGYITIYNYYAFQNNLL